MLVDIRSDGIVYGAGDLGRGYAATLDDVQRFLRTAPTKTGFPTSSPRDE